MTLSRKDLAATVLTALVVLAFTATHEGWDVPLIGDSHRWAAAVILTLGAFACGQGEAQDLRRLWPFAVLGSIALAFAVLALVTGSLTALSLLVVTIVALWALATLRHAFPRSALPV
jgi:hypothetical protein